jgi:hypothetical protein
MVAITGFYLFPMYLVGHWHMYALLCFGIAVVAAFCLSKTWYPYLPSEKDAI